MHREIQGQIEQILANAASRSASEHLEHCAECRNEVEIMRDHARLMRELGAAQAVEARPGFYARVMERIEAEGPVSIWNLFMESAFGRRIAVASLALALVLGVYMVSSEMSDEPIIADQSTSQQVEAPQAIANDALPVLSASAPEGVAIAGGDVSAQMMMQQQRLMEQMIIQMDNAASEGQVLVNLATYQEQ